MTYAQKLRASKILLTISIFLYALIPLIIDFGPSHIYSEVWTPHARFHLSWTLIQNILAAPVLLYLLWSKLHGSGRSVRTVAFLGLAYTVSFFIAMALRPALGSALYDPEHQSLIAGMDANMVGITVNFILIVIAAILSIKPRHLG